MVKHEAVNKTKKKDNQSGIIITIIVGVVLLAIVGSLFFFKPFETEDLSRYNAFKFEQRGKFWITFVELNGVSFEVPFYNHPTEVEDLFYDEQVSTLILDVPHSKFWIAVSDNVGATPVLAGANIGRVTGKLYGVPTQSALYVEPELRDENQTAFPYLTCADATSTQPIIWINPQTELQGNYISEESEFCIIVGGNGDEEILESSDLLAYKILGIMQ